MTHQPIQVTVEDLEEENARLIALLDANGIEWRKSAPPVAKVEAPHGQLRLIQKTLPRTPGHIPCTVAEQGKW
jgi:hypothetical protein